MATMLRSRTTPRTGPKSAAPAWAFLACGGLAVVLYAFGPTELGPPVAVLVQVGSIVATLVGVLRHQPKGQRRPWWAMVVALLAFFGGAILRVTVPGASAVPAGPAAFIPDLLVIPGYLLFAYALIDMLRRRRASADDPARADALLIGLCAAVATWSFFIAPAIGASVVPTLPQVMVAFFPMVDVLLLVIVAYLVLADGVRRPALWLLGGAASAMFAGDLLFAVRADGLSLTSPLLTLIDVLFLLCYVTIGAAALHPSMRTLTEPQPVVLRRLGFVRTAGITATLVAPTAMATLAPPPTVWNGLVRIGLSALLTLTIIARIVRANNARAKAEESARWRATHDALTGLPNRELLADTITSWREADGQREVSLLFIDLDRFKLINDNWGHAVGDELLCAVAGKLLSLVRAEDIVCRIGGDEFVIALGSSTDTGPPLAEARSGPLAERRSEPLAEARSEPLARRVLAEFAEPFTLSVGEVTVTPSIGIAWNSGTVDALELLRDGDTAMYKAKTAGGNAYAYFDSSLRENVRARVDLEQAFRGALERGELAVHYQPIIDLTTDELAGFEALMRWSHPQLGTVSPLEFIPIAEDTGLIVVSGAWLLREAASQLVQWRNERPVDLPPLHMSVNIAVRQLRDSSLVDVVRGVLAETELPPSALWLEITESGVLDATALATLRELRALGVTLAIDDFGTGHSSLAYLRRFPAGVIKIDRSFVAGIGQNGDDESIVRTVIAMAQALGLQVVAEGVETVLQRDWLRALGCGLAQGWLYGAPRPATARLTWMEYTVDGRVEIIQSTVSPRR
jgi:predicted signal transduction protein with EAL and GGDEF domain